MDVILHCGAHRCATTSFQNYLRRNERVLEDQGLAYWGPERTRANGLNSLNNLTQDVYDDLRRELDACARRGAGQLLVSQENFVGSMERNIAFASLYPSVQERGQLLAKAFDGRVTKLALNIRALDMYWSSVAAYKFKRGSAPIEPAKWKRIAQGKRSWCDVITDFSRAFPGIPLLVMPFEDFAGQQQAQLEVLSGRVAPAFSDGLALNAASSPAPNGLSVEQAMKLWADYADDLAWLASGADGLAELICRTETNTCGAAPAEIGIEQRKST
ncbi:hypothetical protein SAMN05444358_1011411 [Ruegeria halocynthiae]|uniref:Sulfotransferase family protein n=1 Tax=Ruegeria halocynthiae TaxID=985054 RepID=A0A1H2VAA7_9RHOB|nr:hypothetical protein [Ruegeria halocynthiae]SDW65210.1 hypothetical protein SAMN05444358_1011411 [Ruegeria halocynthiae]